MVLQFIGGLGNKAPVKENVLFVFLNEWTVWPSTTAPFLSAEYFPGEVMDAHSVFVKRDPHEVRVQCDITSKKKDTGKDEVMQRLSAGVILLSRVI